MFRNRTLRADGTRKQEKACHLTEPLRTEKSGREHKYPDPLTRELYRRYYLSAELPVRGILWTNIGCVQQNKVFQYLYPGSAFGLAC